MENERSFLSQGAELRLGETTYKIRAFIGAGSNSAAYTATYPDTLSPSLSHNVIIKELFPYDRGNGIYRDDKLFINVREEARQLFALHRESFIRGNEAHIRLSGEQPDSVSANMNTFEAYGTLYSIIGYSGGGTMLSYMAECAASDLRSKASVIGKIAAALSVFHRNGMLHLDISPDNILFITESGNDAREPDRCILIDYNSIWEYNAPDASHEGHFSIKKHYSAPELILNDIGSIGYGTDIYSVCSVFFELVCGKPFDDNGYRRTVHDRIVGEACGEQPDTVTYMLKRIFAKGLNINPGYRYKSTDELRGDIDELIRRIDGRGVSHSALWNASYRRIAQKHTGGTEQMPPENDGYIILDAELGRTEADRTTVTTDVLIADCLAGRLGNTVITGCAGAGKSTLLDNICRAGVAAYHPRLPVPCCIPLAGFDGDSEYIVNRLLSALKSTDRNESVADARRKLYELLGQDNNGVPSVLLLLDGFNEVHDERSALVRQINMISKLSGVRVLITSRSSDDTGYCFTGFDTVRLLPVRDGILRAKLSDAGIFIPESPEVLSLLTNPLMLTMALTAYGHSSRPDASVIPDGITRDGLVRRYISRVLDNYRSACDGDEAGGLRAKYTVNIMFTQICGHMQRREGPVKGKDILRIAEKSYAGLRSGSVARAFPEYLGKAGMITGGISSGEEWFEATVNKLLCRDLGLLQISDTSMNTYIPMHSEILPAVAKNSAGIGRRLFGAGLRRRLPVISVAAALLIAVSLAVPAIVKYERGRHYPANAAEAGILEDAMLTMSNSVCRAAISRDSLVDYTEKCAENRDKAYADDFIREYSEVLLENSKKRLMTSYEMKSSERGADYYASVMPADRLDFDINAYAGLLNSIKASNDYERKIIDAYLTFQSGRHTAEQYTALDTAIGAYADAAVRLDFYSVLDIIADMDEDTVNSVTDRLAETYLIRDIYSKEYTTDRDIIDKKLSYCKTELERTKKELVYAGLLSLKDE